jgi:hypothetical protein
MFSNNENDQISLVPLPSSCQAKFFALECRAAMK